MFGEAFRSTKFALQIQLTKAAERSSQEGRHAGPGGDIEKIIQNATDLQLASGVVSAPATDDHRNNSTS